MCLVSCGGKGDSHDDEQQGRRAEQTSHSVIPRIKSGSGVANAPLGGAFSPGSVERRKNSVIIASPYISSEVPVLPTFTLFSLSPKSTDAASHPARTPVLALESARWGGLTEASVHRVSGVGGTRSPWRPTAAVIAYVVTFSLPMARQSTHQTKPNAEKNPRRDPTAAGQ